MEQLFIEQTSYRACNTLSKTTNSNSYFSCRFVPQATITISPNIVICAVIRQTYLILSTNKKPFSWDLYLLQPVTQINHLAVRLNRQGYRHLPLLLAISINGFSDRSEIDGCGLPPSRLVHFRQKSVRPVPTSHQVDLLTIRSPGKPPTRLIPNSPRQLDEIINPASIASPNAAEMPSPAELRFPKSVLYPPNAISASQTRRSGDYRTNTAQSCAIRAEPPMPIQPLKTPRNAPTPEA
ncbi:hypothetical protein ACQ86N_16870 [Puia sp. P3]|uniref:hypothetical protein n=1 Tax=Puia sp. P3 TaxID=3423952 RepID=UPI003D66AACA